MRPVIAAGTMLGMTTPTVTERPQALQPVTPPTFVFTAVRDHNARSIATATRPSRRIVD
jgi:hypothetical protein